MRKSTPDTQARQVIVESRTFNKHNRYRVWYYKCIEQYIIIESLRNVIYIYYNYTFRAPGSSSGCVVKSQIKLHIGPLWLGMGVGERNFVLKFNVVFIECPRLYNMFNENTTGMTHLNTSLCFKNNMYLKRNSVCHLSMTHTSFNRINNTGTSRVT
jgi:hypothetical protein